MNLNVKDRVLLLNMLPQNGNLTTMSLIMEIVKKLRLTPDEVDRYEYEETEGGVKINPSKINEAVEIDFNVSELNLLQEAVRKLDSDNQINLYNVDTCLKIQNL